MSEKKAKKETKPKKSPKDYDRFGGVVGVKAIKKPQSKGK